MPTPGTTSGPPADTARPQVGGGAPTRRSEDVYWTLRHEITHGMLRPNSALVEDEIAARLGVSRTPVRESMQRLASDGLIASRRRRWVVREHSPEEIVQLYEVRAGLESYAARLAAQRATPVQLAEIESWRERMTSEDARALADRAGTNDRFHDVITAASGNPRMLRMVHDNRLFHFNLRLASLYSTEDLLVSSRQHGEIITAVCARDADRVERAAREHVEYSLTLILDKLF